MDFAVWLETPSCIKVNKESNAISQNFFILFLSRGLLDEVKRSWPINDDYSPYYYIWWMLLNAELFELLSHISSGKPAGFYNVDSPKALPENID